MTGRIAPGAVVAIQDAFDEWHPARATSSVIAARSRHEFAKVMCVPLLRRQEEVPIPVEDVIVIANA